MESLNDFLVKQLEPISEADPELLANYVGALLKNEKPLDQLKILCLEQLTEFLNEGKASSDLASVVGQRSNKALLGCADTETFVNTLFEALESGIVQLEDDEAFDNETGAESKGGAEASVSMIGLPSQDGSATVALSNIEAGGAKDVSIVSPVGAVPEAGGVGTVGGGGEEDGVAYESSEDDEDRNHKHRRRAAGARLARERIEEGEMRASGGGENALIKKRPLPDADRAPRQNFGRPLQDSRRSLQPTNHNIRNRDGGRTRFGPLDGGRLGMQRRVGVAFRGDERDRFENDRGNMMPGTAGAGGNGWAPFDRFGGPLSPFLDGPSPRVGPGAYFPGRGAGVPFRGPMQGPRGPPGAPGSWNEFGPGGGAHGDVPIGPGMPGGGPGMSAMMGRGVAGGARPQRCPDFDNQGFCLKGDTCPLDHGADRIVLEDIQHLHSLNLPVNQGRPSGPMGLPEVASGVRMPAVRRGMQPGMEGIPNEGLGSGELYDPDRPSWSGNGLRPQGSAGGLTRLSSLKRAALDGGFANGGSEEEKKAGGGGSVWERIKPAPSVGGMGGMPVMEGGPGMGMGMGSGQSGEWPVDVWNRGMNATTGLPAPPRDDTPPRFEGAGGGAGGLNGRGRGRGRGRFGSPGGRGDGGEDGTRAERTLCVLNLPADADSVEAELVKHFRVFGLVVNVSVTVGRGVAFVQFARRADAEKALVAPEAVLGNRFIRLKWANFDTQPHFDALPRPPTNPATTPGLGAPAVAVPAGVNGSPTEKMGVALTPPDGAPGVVAARTPPQPLASQGPVGPAATAAAAGGGGGGGGSSQEVATKYAKLMELKAAEDALREKKLAEQKRFQELLKRKAERDAQPARETTPAAKRPNTASDVTPDGKTTAGAVPTEDSARGGDGEAKPFFTPPKTESPTAVGFGMRSVGGGRGRGRARGAPGGYQGGGWGGGFRNKIDNRTTVLRLVPPLPPVAEDTAVLWDHFSSFGEIASIEEEGKGGGGEESGCVGGVRVTYAHRRSAEVALGEGKVIQGVSVQLAWAAPARKTPLPPPLTPTKPPAQGTTNELAMAGGVVTAGVYPPEGGGEKELKSGLGAGSPLGAVPNGKSPLLEVG